jgi:hypothetical protein
MYPFKLPLPEKREGISLGISFLNLSRITVRSGLAGMHVQPVLGNIFALLCHAERRMKSAKATSFGVEASLWLSSRPGVGTSFHARK